MVAKATDAVAVDDIEVVSIRNARVDTFRVHHVELSWPVLPTYLQHVQQYEQSHSHYSIGSNQVSIL